MGVAVRVTTVPWSYFALQVAPQSIPAGALVTLPLPVPALLTVSVYCGTAVSNAGSEYATYAHFVKPLPASAWAGWVGAWTSATIILVPAVALLLFPDGRPPPRRWRLAAGSQPTPTQRAKRGRGEPKRTPPRKARRRKNRAGLQHFLGLRNPAELSAKARLIASKPAGQKANHGARSIPPTAIFAHLRWPGE